MYRRCSRSRRALTLALLCSWAPAARGADVDGTWAGAMNTDRDGPGALEIVLRREGSQPTRWKATLKIRPGSNVLIPTVQSTTIDGIKLVVTAQHDDVALKLVGRFSGDRLIGTLEGSKDQRAGVQGTFNLQRGGVMLAPPPPAAGGGQVADPAFDVKVDNPAYQDEGPKVLFDEAHHNFHTADGRYKPFADLITNDGFQIFRSQQKLTADRLRGHQVLVIANAVGAEGLDTPEAARPAFTDAECNAVRDWVRAGGALLLITDHAPTGSANQSLARRFGVDMSKGSTVDSENHDKDGNDDGAILYTKDNGGLLDHPITRGRGEPERVNRVMTFVGQSLKGPAGSVPFLRLSRAAEDIGPGAAGKRPAAGRAQGIAFSHGKGRVVVLGEAAMLSAQVVGPERRTFGMNRPNIDNRQLALNVMRWLAGTLR